MAAAKKNLALPLKKAAIAVLTPPSKWPRPDAKAAGDVLQPKKHVKKLAKKGEREIHVISIQTTGATTLSVSVPSPAVKVLAMVL